VVWPLESDEARGREPMGMLLVLLTGRAGGERGGGTFLIG